MTPCAPGSRLGIRRCGLPDVLPRGVEGLHFHTLCEQDAAPLVETFAAFEKAFGSYLHGLKWLNLGGGHHITRPGYDIAALEQLIMYIRRTYSVEVYLEPGEAIALQAGTLITTVLDVVQASDMPVLILDTSAACHMPDVLEMPYRPPLYGAGEPGEKACTCRLASRTCLAGDVIGEYSFDTCPQVGDRLVLATWRSIPWSRTTPSTGCLCRISPCAAPTAAAKWSTILTIRISKRGFPERMRGFAYVQNAG